MSNRLKRGVPIGVIPLLCSTFLSLSLPSSPARANPGNQYAVCMSDLTNNGVSGDRAATACAGALIPKELSWCVGKIKGETSIDAENAVKACYRVRRPIDLGNCVADIYKGVPAIAAAPAQPTATPAPQTTDAANSPPPETTTEVAAKFQAAASGTPPEIIPPDSLPLMALDGCRRSLLPGPYSECVIAASRDVQGMTPDAALQTCIAAEDFPRDLFPAYTEN